MTKYTYNIGIDPGTRSGLCVFNTQTKEIVLLKTVSILDAIDIVKEYFYDKEGLTHVVVEDARLRKWGFKKGAEQGAGSIKRDCNIWEEFLTKHKIPNRFTHPIKGMTKIKEPLFKQMTKYQGQTSEHARDACLLVYRN